MTKVRPTFKKLHEVDTVLGASQCKVEKPSFALAIIGTSKPAFFIKPCFSINAATTQRSMMFRSSPNTMSFKYRRGMSYQYDNSTPEVTIWSLDGNEAVLMIHSFGADAGADVVREVVQETAGVFKGMGGKISMGRCELRVGGTALSGERMDINLNGILLRQEYYGLRIGSHRVVLVLQDSLSDNGETTDEFRNMKSLFEKTSTVTK